MSNVIELQRDRETLLAARAFTAAGRKVVALSPRAKAADYDWAGPPLTDDTITTKFARDANLAVALGADSGGLVDIDFDSPTSARIADVLLGTMPSYGRAGSPRSHRWVICEEAVKKPKDCTHVAFKLPASLAEHPRLQGPHGIMLLEVRANGCYSVTPPSTHPSGEKMESDGNLYAPPTWFWPQVITSAGLIAFLDICVRLYPPHGHRHPFCMALAGTLVRALLPTVRRDGKSDGVLFDDETAMVEYVDGLVKLVGDLAGGGKAHKGKFAARALARIKSGANVTGLATILKMLGIPDSEHAYFARWLGKVNHDERPRLVWWESDYPAIMTRAATILADAAVGIYQRGGMLVHVYRTDRDDDPEGPALIKRKAGALLIHAIDANRLNQYMTETINFIELHETKKGTVEIPIAAPTMLSQHFLSAADQWRMPVLDGISEVPTMRADGTIVQADGYDPESRLLLDKNGVEYPAIPDAPTQEQATAALKVLIDVLDEFPFVDKPSLSVALSAILTSFVRHLMSNAPVHGFDANSFGTGKSTLADVVSLIATGRTAPAMTFTDDQEESEKRWLSTLLAGDRVVSLDNVEPGTSVGGGVFNKVSSQETFSTRLLGSNTVPVVSTAVLIMVNGNNLQFANDTVSRCIKARMNAGMENPDRRTFKRDIYNYVPQHRPELVAAALTVLRGYIAAGRPFDKTESRFKVWDRLVRGALIWAGAADPMDTQAESYALDPSKADRAALINAMQKCFGKGKAVPFPTAQEIVDRSRESDDAGRALEAALRPHMGPRSNGIISSRGVSTYLKNERDVVVNGRCLRMRANASDAARFWVEEVPEQASMFEGTGN
jgi:hypothetical protein